MKQTIAPIECLFEDRGEILKDSLEHNPSQTIQGVTIDQRGVTLREDGYQVSTTEIDGVFSLQGIFVDGTQLWRDPTLLRQAGENVSSLYDGSEGVGPLVRPMVDRKLCERLGLQSSTANRALVAEVKIDLDGNTHGFNSKLVMAKVKEWTHEKFGKQLYQRRHGDIVIDVARAALKNLGTCMPEQLQDEYVFEDRSKQRFRSASIIQVCFANLIYRSFAEHARDNGQKWLYRATETARGAHTSPRLTVDPLMHRHVDSVYMVISPAFRELEALINQSLARYYSLGGSPDGIDHELLAAYAQRINDYHAEQSASIKPKKAAAVLGKAA